MMDATEGVRAGEQRERLQALSVLAVDIAEVRDLPRVLDTALRHCLALTGSQFGFIGLNDAAGAALDVVAIHGFDASARFYERYHLIPLRPNIFARAILENRPVRTDDATHAPERIGQPAEHPPVRAFLGVPLRLHGAPIGMIGVANRAGAYDDEHEHLLLTYAAQVAIAIRNAQLYEELACAKDDLERKVAERTRELAEAKEALARKAGDLRLLLTQTVSAQERERARIAHDMHDGLNQLIIGAILELKAARQRLDSSDHAPADASLQRVRTVLGQVDGEIKRIIHDLRPPSLDVLGLSAAITRYAERYRDFTGLPCGVEVSARPYRLISEAEIGIYRVIQEALQNAMGITAVPTGGRMGGGGRRRSGVRHAPGRRARGRPSRHRGHVRAGGVAGRVADHRQRAPAGRAGAPDGTGDRVGPAPRRAGRGSRPWTALMAPTLYASSSWTITPSYARG